MKYVFSVAIFLAAAAPFVVVPAFAQQTQEKADIRDLIGEVKSALEKGDSKKAYDTVIKALNQDNDHPEANFLLGKMYLDGVHVRPNKARAINRFMNAAAKKDEKGNLAYPEAAYVIGKAFLAGDGVPMSPATAFEWFMKAAPNHPESLVQAGEMRLTGFGVNRNFNIALDMLSKAAEAGASRAYNLLEKMHEEGYITKDQAYFGLNLPRAQPLTEEARKVKESIFSYIDDMTVAGPGQPRLVLGEELYFFEDIDQGKYRMILPDVSFDLPDGGKLFLGTIRTRIDKEPFSEGAYGVEVIVPGDVRRFRSNGSTAWSISLNQRTFDGSWSTDLNNFSGFQFTAENSVLEIGEIPNNITLSLTSIFVEQGSVRNADGTWMVDIKSEIDGLRLNDRRFDDCCLYLGRAALKGNLDKVKFNDFGDILSRVGFDPLTGFWGRRQSVEEMDFTLKTVPVFLDTLWLQMKAAGVIARDKDDNIRYSFDHGGIEFMLTDSEGMASKDPKTGATSQLEVSFDVAGLDINNADVNKSLNGGKLVGKVLIEQLATEALRKGVVGVVTNYARRLAEMGSGEDVIESRGNFYQLLNRAAPRLFTALFLAEPGLNIFNMVFDIEKTTFDLTGYLRAKRDAENKAVMSMEFKITDLRSLLEKIAPPGREVRLDPEYQAVLDMGDRVEREDGREDVGFVVSAKMTGPITVNGKDASLQLINLLQSLMNQTASASPTPFPVPSE